MLQKLEISPDAFPGQCEQIVRDILRAYVLRLAKDGSVQAACNTLDRYILQSLAGKSTENVEGVHE
jgi:hypothetical protein